MRTATLSLALIVSLTGCQYGRYTPAEDVGTIPGGTMPTTIGTTPTTPVTTPVDNDVDGDGFDNEASGGDDCNDSDASVNPDATDDTCDGVDQNCDEFDGTVSPEARAASACGGVDTDGDGFMDVDGDGEIVDCDDANPAINPLADEIWYDGVDQNCNADDDFDQDMDGHASDDFAGDDCNDLDSSVSPSDAEVLDDGVDQNCDPTDDTSGNGIVDDDLDGYALADDCDDANPAINPGAIEIAYNGIDENCDTKDITDVDCDGVALLDESGNVLDCDDNLDTVYPNAPEVLADGVDQDCDGVDGAAPVVDTDGDGSEDNLDCDDANPLVNPSMVEVCGNEIDENCDGSAPGLGAIFPDVDDDGHGDINSGLIDDFACEDAVPEGFVYTDRLDCDDSNPDVYIGAIEVADDGIDQDCDGSDLVTVVEEPLPHPEDCAGGFSKVYGTFTGPVGSTITAISGERIPLVGSDDIIPWMAWSDGSPVNMTVDFVGNVGTFTLDACVDDAADWNASVTYTDAAGAVHYDCEGSVFTGAWTVEFDNDVQTVTPEVWDLVNGSCNALW